MREKYYPRNQLRGIDFMNNYLLQKDLSNYNIDYFRGVSDIFSVPLPPLFCEYEKEEIIP